MVCFIGALIKSNILDMSSSYCQIQWKRRTCKKCPLLRPRKPYFDHRIFEMFNLRVTRRSITEAQPSGTSYALFKKHSPTALAVLCVRNSDYRHLVLSHGMMIETLPDRFLLPQDKKIQMPKPLPKCGNPSFWPTSKHKPTVRQRKCKYVAINLQAARLASRYWERNYSLSWRVIETAQPTIYTSTNRAKPCKPKLRNSWNVASNENMTTSRATQKTEFFAVSTSIGIWRFKDTIARQESAQSNLSSTLSVNPPFREECYSSSYISPKCPIPTQDAFTQLTTIWSKRCRNLQADNIKNGKLYCSILDVSAFIIVEAEVLQRLTGSPAYYAGDPVRRCST